MGEFVGLPGVVGNLPGICISPSLRQFKRTLLEHRACSTAADNGAVTIWRDDAGQWRGDRSRYWVTQATLTCRTKSEVWMWLRKQLPKIQ